MLPWKRHIFRDTSFGVNEFAYSDGTLSGGSAKWLGGWKVDGVLPKAWSDGTEEGGGAFGGWTWQSDWILS